MGRRLACSGLLSPFSSVSFTLAWRRDPGGADRGRAPASKAGWSSSAGERDPPHSGPRATLLCCLPPSQILSKAPLSSQTLPPEAPSLSRRQASPPVLLTFRGLPGRHLTQPYQNTPTSSPDRSCHQPLFFPPRRPYSEAEGPFSQHESAATCFCGRVQRRGKHKRNPFGAAFSASLPHVSSTVGLWPLGSGRLRIYDGHKGIQAAARSPVNSLTILRAGNGFLM